ncbi:MAG: hypothetical protein J3R72DRAFT_451499 [Linnemannia gamsii]|nr:MAG: hypothetical protein J3R72DRAFT_451499 [Linnemannia gamsii]
MPQQMSTHDALHSFDIHSDLIGRNDGRPDQQQQQNHCTINKSSSLSKRILLTGGAGFIGSVLVRKLVLNYPEYLIVVVDKLDYCSSLNNLRPFLLFPGDQDDTAANYSQDTSSTATIVTTAAAESQLRWTQSTDSLHPNDAEFGAGRHHRRGNNNRINDIRWSNNPQYPNFVYLFGDITDVAFIDSTMAEYKINTILHLAAQTHVDKSFGESIEFTQNNVLGTHVLLEAARKYFCTPPSRTAAKNGQGRANGQDRGLGTNDEQEEGDSVEKRFVFVSTDEVYGQCLLGQPDCKEDATMAASNPYSATKAAAECMVQAYYKSFHLPIVITRSNNVYGPFQYPEKIFPKFMMSLLHPDSCKAKKSTQGHGSGSVGEEGGEGELSNGGGEISGGHCYIHGSGQHSRTYLYVADAANALDVILHRGVVGEVYNIGAGHELSNIELAQDLIHRLVEPWPTSASNSTDRTLWNGCGGDAPIEYACVSIRQEKANKHQGECRTCGDRIVFVEDRAFNDQRYAVDSTKLCGLGWSPRVRYEQGIVNTIEWFRYNGRTWWGDIHRALYPHSVKRSTSEQNLALTIRLSDK